MKITTINTLHIVLRGGNTISSDYKGILAKGDILEEHNGIVKRSGKVLFGKVGKSVQEYKLSLLQEAIVKGKSYLFLVRKEQGQLKVLKAPLYNAHSKDFEPELELVPKYYWNIINQITLWLEIGLLEFTSQDELEQLVLLSNGRLLTEVLLTCRTSVMLVHSNQKPL